MVHHKRNHPSTSSRSETSTAIGSSIFREKGHKRHKGHKGLKGHKGSRNQQKGPSHPFRLLKSLLSLSSLKDCHVEQSSPRNDDTEKRHPEERSDMGIYYNARQKKCG